MPDTTTFISCVTSQKEFVEPLGQAGSKHPKDFEMFQKQRNWTKFNHKCLTRFYKTEPPISKKLHSTSNGNNTSSDMLGMF